MESGGAGIEPAAPAVFSGRAFEFASIVVVGVSLAGAGLAMIEQAFARPLAMVATALAP